MYSSDARSEEQSAYSLLEGRGTRRTSLGPMPRLSVLVGAGEMSDLFEHPAGIFLSSRNREAIKISLDQNGFSAYG